QPGRSSRPPGARGGTSLGQQSSGLLSARFQIGQARLGVGQQPDRSLVCRNQLIQGRRPLRKLAHGGFELREKIVELPDLTQVAVAATRPRIPLTNLPESSPEKVLASSMDSLIAALVGTLRSMAISYTAIRRMMRSTFAIWSSFQCSDASLMIASSRSRLAITPSTSWRAKFVTSSPAPFSDAW